MQELNIPKSAYRRLSAQIPSLECVNYYYEKSEIGDYWLPRPGLNKFYSGSGQLRGMFRADGIMNSNLIAIIDNKVYSIDEQGNSTELGTVGGSDLVSIAGNTAGVMLADGENLFYILNDGTFQTITRPEGLTKPVWVGYLSGYWLCVNGDSFRRYWCPDTTPTTWDELDYDAASTRPDPLVCSAICMDRIWDLGTSTVEFRYASGDIDSPFVVEEGRQYEKGCLSKDSVVVLDNTVVWLGNDRILYRGGNVPEAISDAFLSERIGRVNISEIYAFGYAFEGHVFYCITIGSEGTYAYDLTTGTWSEWRTYKADNWLAGICVDGWDSSPIFGNRDTGDLYTFDSDKFSDDGKQLVGILNGFTPIKAIRSIINNLVIEMSTGYNLNDGYGSEPVIELFISRDGGYTYGDAITLGMGKQGQFNWRVIARRLGLFRPPVAMFKFRISDPIPRRINSAYINGAF